MKTKTSPKKSAQSSLENLNHVLWLERMKPVPLLQKLTPMEQQICVSIWMEKSDKEIQDLIGLSRATIHFHVLNICKKLKVTNRLGVALAFERSLHDSPKRVSPWRNLP
jgi:DNA-binding CsgD family transcriptional regulator